MQLLVIEKSYLTGFKYAIIFIKQIFNFKDSSQFDDKLFFGNRHYTWGNVNDPIDLKNYLDREVANAFQNGL